MKIVFIFFSNLEFQIFRFERLTFRHNNSPQTVSNDNFVQIKFFLRQFVGVFEFVQLIRQQNNWRLFIVCTDQSKWSNGIRTHCKRIGIRQLKISIDVCKLILRNRVCSYVKHGISVFPFTTSGEFSIESNGRSLWCGAFIVVKFLNTFFLLLFLLSVKSMKNHLNSNWQENDRSRFITFVFWSCNNGKTFLQPNSYESIHLSQLLYDVDNCTDFLSDWLRKRYLYNDFEFYTTCWARFAIQIRFENFNRACNYERKIISQRW